MTPTQMLWFFALTFGVASAVGPAGADLPKEAHLSAHVALSLIIALWIIEDARKQGRKLCYDYDSLVYLFWPAVAPVYLFQTRGLKAFRTLLGFIAISLTAWLAEMVVLFIRKLS
jgi:hypothetical protein